MHTTTFYVHFIDRSVYLRLTEVILHWMRFIKVAEDDIAFKLAILKKSLHLNDNTCFCSIIQSSKLFLGSLLAKNNFFANFEQKILHPPGWPIVGVAYRRSGPSAAKMQLKRRIRHCPVACG